VTATLTFHPLGNADCTRLDLADGKKLLIDYADMRNPDDRWDRRIDVPAELRSDLRAAQRDYYNVVGYTHLDDDHCRGSGDFFWFEHAAKYQTEDRIKIRELWVPAAAIKLKEWLEANGLTLESRAHLITDAGHFVQGNESRLR
jgi:hypothetical protein